jgi:transposase
MDTNGKRRRNKRWPEALKREIVAATLAPGVSISVVARQYDVNANQVFIWRRRYGPSTEAVVPSTPRPQLVPVTVSAERETVSPPLPATVPDGGIEIEVAGVYRVRVPANVDCHLLRRVLDCLVRR